MKKIHILFAALLVPFVAVACAKLGTVEIEEVYAFETSKNNAAAIFMTVNNFTGRADRMIDFKTNIAGRTELHTMSMDNDVMRMRRVDGYDYPVDADVPHVLSPMGDHIMLFDLDRDLVAGDEFYGVVVFEKYGEIPVTVNVKSRKVEPIDIQSHTGNHNH